MRIFSVQRRAFEVGQCLEGFRKSKLCILSNDFQFYADAALNSVCHHANFYSNFITIGRSSLFHTISYTFDHFICHPFDQTIRVILNPVMLIIIKWQTPIPFTLISDSNHFQIIITLTIWHCSQKYRFCFVQQNCVRLYFYASTLLFAFTLWTKCEFKL